MKYSFIIPVYGCEKYLEACVESILNQKGKHSFEIILIDDGATDRSGIIADDLDRRYANVRTFHKENGGAASARNRGVQESRGEYILFVDGDDTVEVGLLDAVDEELQKHPEAMILFGMSFDYYRGDNLVRRELLSCNHKGSIDKTQLLADYRSFFFDNALSSSCNKVFSSTVLRAHGLWFAEGMTLYEDYDFVLRYLVNTKSVVCLEQPFYHYRNNLEKSHLNTRVQDLTKLQENLSQLLISSSVLDCGGSQLGDVAVNLYIQLLWQHLLVKKYTTTEMSVSIKEYCQFPLFRKLLAQGARLNETEAELLHLIEKEAFGQILQRRNCSVRTAWLKRSIKKIINLIGLRI